MNIQKENPAQRNRILFFAWFNILSNNVYFFCAAASASAAVFDGDCQEVCVNNLSR